MQARHMREHEGRTPSGIGSGDTPDAALSRRVWNGACRCAAAVLFGRDLSRATIGLSVVEDRSRPGRGKYRLEGGGADCAGSADG